MIGAHLILYQLAAVASYAAAPAAVGRATVFSSVDRWNPATDLACSWSDARHRRLRALDDATDAVVAHRDWPCGARVLLVNPRNGRATVARVGDRGPLRAPIDISLLVARRLRLGRGGGRLAWILLDVSPLPPDPLRRDARPIRARACPGGVP
jgi:hypothetical protein